MFFYCFSQFRYIIWITCIICCSPSELCVVPEAGLYNLSVKSTKNKTGVVDLFAVGDGRQTISIHETVSIPYHFESV